MFAALSAAIAGFYAHLAPWLILGFVLVAVDLRFGIKAARARGEKIRLSRAWRRTLNKCIDYLGWVTVAELLSRTFELAMGAPVVPLAVLFFIYGIELSSCINNYLEYKGLPWRLNVWSLFKRRGEFGDALEPTDHSSDHINPDSHGKD